MNAAAPFEPIAFHDGRVVLHPGDCLAWLDRLAPNSVDAVVTDPPYHLTSIVKRFGKTAAAPVKGQTSLGGAYRRGSAGFMGKVWDGGDIAFDPATWARVLRVLKPGGHMLAFAASKNSHRMICAIEDAGFEVRDALLWMYGTGFPKSLDVSKMIDKAAGAKRKVIAREKVRDIRNGHGRGVGDGIHASGRDAPVYMDRDVTIPATAEAEAWQGWGTALKPAYEPICLARKPISESSVAANVLRWGTGALNIDASRIGAALRSRSRSTGEKISDNVSMAGGNYAREFDGLVEGRWPANVLHDGGAEVLSAFPQEDGETAARFFYSAKADSDDRIGSKHPTVKPIDLMRWCVRLATPPGGLVLDPFSGTGTTGEAALLEGMRAWLIEREPEYQADIARRLATVFDGGLARTKAKAARATAPDAGPLFGGTAFAGGGVRSTEPSRTRPDDRPDRIQTVSEAR